MILMAIKLSHKIFPVLEVMQLSRRKEKLYIPMDIGGTKPES